MYQALYREYRPRTFDDVVGQNHITDTLKRQVAAGRLSHAYLFTGTRGTGKTSCAKILSRAVNCEHPVDGNPCNQCAACRGIENGSILDVLELDAASNNRVDDIRAILDEVTYTPASVKKRVYIVDEVHMLTAQAFNALLKILEEPPEHLMFILATTELHKVPATIKSRCQQFAFKRILPADIAARLAGVAQQEGIDLTGEGAALLARLADGGLRDALSLLDQCMAPGHSIGEQEVLDALGLAGNIETARLMEQIGCGDTAQAVETLARLYRAGKEVGSLLGELSALSRDLLIRKTAPQGGAALLTGGYDEATLRRLAGLFTPQRLVQALGLLQETLAQLSRSGNRRTDAELCLIRLCDETLDASLAGMNARLARLEEQAQGGGLVPAAKPAAKPAPAASAGEPATQRPAAVPAPETPKPEAPAPRQQAPTPPPAAPAGDPPPRPATPAGDLPPRPATPAGGEGEFWPALAASLKGRVPMGEYTFLANPAMVQARAADGVLTLYAESDFVRTMIHKSAVLEPVKQAAGAVLGDIRRVEVTVGKPPAGVPAPAPQAPTAQAPAEDALDELLAFGQFDNIVIKE